MFESMKWPSNHWRPFWIFWCLLWAFLWFCASLVNHWDLIMVIASVACLLIPVGKTRPAKE